MCELGGISAERQNSKKESSTRLDLEMIISGMKNCLDGPISKIDTVE